MANSTASARRSAPASVGAAEATEEPTSAAPWLTVVSDKVKSMRYGVVQIVIHDSKVVQIERTERTRFEVPQSAAQR
ncbi:MAG: YezD family protein [Chthoniobacter sp.]|nr:YezD family protein [Chthoniobacter sp.]